MARFRRTLGLVLVCCLLVGAGALALAEEHEHVYEWVETKSSTCTTYGTEEYKCSCGDVKDTRQKALSEHAMTDWATVKSATCTTEGV